jgi:chromate transporter
MLSISESSMGKPASTLWQMVLYKLRLGTLGFGGPVIGAAAIGANHRLGYRDRAPLDRRSAHH